MYSSTFIDKTGQLSEQKYSRQNTALPERRRLEQRLFVSRTNSAV